MAAIRESWSRKPLGAVADVVSGYAFKSSEFGERGIPVIKIKNVRVGHIDLSEVEHVDEKYLSIPERYHVRAGDVLISLTGSHISQPNSVVGRVARHSAGLPHCLLNQRAGKVIVTDSGKCDLGFLFYALSEQETVRAIAMRAHGAANQANVSPTQVESVEIPVPPLPVQRRIAGILLAYDELMENSQRRIRILEAMARALYHEWFVEFRFPVATTVGNIPTGWEMKRLDQVAEIKGGKQLVKDDIHEAGEFPVFGGNGIQGYSEKATHDGFVIAFGRVGAYCGSIHWSYRGAWLNNNSSSVVPLKHDELVLHHLLGFNFTNLRSGAAQPFISNTALARIELVFPGDALAEKFCSLVKPLRLQQVTLEKSVQNLRRTRDLLLPRLLSGKFGLVND
jgi:type I restriction enzyme, S subunit